MLPRQSGCFNQLLCYFAVGYLMSLFLQVSLGYNSRVAGFIYWPSRPLWPWSLLLLVAYLTNRAAHRSIHRSWLALWTILILSTLVPVIGHGYPGPNGSGAALLHLK